LGMSRVYTSKSCLVVFRPALNAPGYCRDYAARSFAAIRRACVSNVALLIFILRSCAAIDSRRFADCVRGFKARCFVTPFVFSVAATHSRMYSASDTGNHIINI
jgi:hypothetical protein